MEQSLDFSKVRDDARVIILALKLLKQQLVSDCRVRVLPEKITIEMMNNLPVLENNRGFQVFYDRVTDKYQVAVTSFAYTLGFFDLKTTVEILVADMLATNISGESVCFIATPHEHEENYYALLKTFIEDGQD
jgi:hypothetical protein